MPIDYETLRVIWWVLLGVLLAGFAIMDGFDLGVAMWLPFFGRNDTERRILINTIGPTWEGNQVWFILGGGAIFAAWPALYALSFSGFYLAMLVVLLALILRPVGFKYRSKINSPLWRSVWDWALFTGGFVPALIFGVAVGNVLQGVPFFFDTELRPFYTGTFFELLNPFALLCGVLSVVMLMMHGAFFLNTKTLDELQARARSGGRVLAFLTVLLFIFGGAALFYAIDGYVLTGFVPHDGPSNPLYKGAMQQEGAWFANYAAIPITLVAPLMGIFGALMAALSASKPKFAFVCSACSLFGIVTTVGVSMFPFILPSSTHPGNSLTVWDSSSSQMTLTIMLVATVVFLPLVLAYTAWVYRVLRGPVTAQTLKDNADTAY
ncbi:cytochrome d ubiquinol oxidase subunit II [Legionella geestiana]|uniref:Cytochrome d ubiquinol oxidase subunit II n=1 Tax=Legionella geestiana TaxID=45065 RepID=A0A0W0U878_9GAMM|nr:cytochrome d ubiquinol oxidase subunit II [Legionella geestiana]KTD04196.1 cytochrome d ubiquinol oxidase subunit II [Legionella geestiana]QBS11620.1 cytochrome d ubiquinol oxidase subunit II [Legionella geestiana]STX53699.1 cytochrome d ubiquinol oxidase subunit II [Legionella geestiana]